jgi:hypothetical protein
MAVIGIDGTLLRTMTCPVSAETRWRLRGARRGSSSPRHPAARSRFSGGCSAAARS